MKRERKYGKLRRAALVLTALCLVFLPWATGCASADREIVATCGGDDVLREEYSFLAGRLTEAGLSEEEIRAKVEPQIITDRAILAAGAELLDGLTVDDKSVKAAVKAGVQSAIDEYGGKSAYKAALSEMSLTEHHLRRMLAVAEIQRLLTERVFAGTELESEESFAAWLTDDAHYARVERFDFRTAGEADAFLSATRDGADTDTVCAAHGGQKSSPTYCFWGLGGEDLDALLFALPADGATLSAVFERETGTFSVYRRLAVSETERADMAALQGLAVRDRLRTLRWDAFLATYESGLEVSWK